MRLSFIVCAYNAEKFIRHALDSIKAQTFTDYECLVVNDGSTDGTKAIIEEYVLRTSDSD